MKYLPPAVATADLDVADAPYEGGEFAVYMTNQPAVLIGQVQLSAVNAAAWVSHLAATIKSGGADLAINVAVGKNLSSSFAPVIALAGLDDLGAAAKAIAVFRPPARAVNQTFNFISGYAGDMTVSTGAARKMATITGLSATLLTCTAAVQVAGGTGYAVGDVVKVLTGAGALAAAGMETTLTVATVTSGAITSLTVLNPGAYTATPSVTANAVVTVTGAGTGATATLTMLTTGVVGGGPNQILNVYQLPEQTDYSFIIATTEIDLPVKSRQAKGIDAGLEADHWVKGGKTMPGELSIGSKFQSFADGMARYAGAPNTCMLVGIKEGQLVNERLVFTRFWPTIKPKAPEGDGEAMFESSGKIVDHLFFVAP